MSIDTEKNEIVLPYYEGRKYNNSWGTKYGGKLMGLELSSEVAEMINDLFKINVKKVESFREVEEIDFFKFDYDKWKKNFYIKIEKYEIDGLLSKEEINRAKTIFNEPYESTYIFNNGDFYPRNFIKSKNKVVLIDWDDWGNSYRANIIDYWENVFAFCFIHMWSNHFWQLNFLKSIQRKLIINPHNLQKALLIKSFEGSYRI